MENQVTFPVGVAEVSFPISVVTKALLDAISQGGTLTPRAAPRIGEYWPGQGGVYAGIMRGEKGLPDYHLIVPVDPKAQVEKISFGESGLQTGSLSELDGAANTKSLCAASSDHAAAHWAAGLEIEGHKDLYLPAKRELALCFVNVGDAFEKEWHWSSTQLPSYPGFAYITYFSGGDQGWYHKGNECRARAVRRLVIS